MEILEENLQPWFWTLIPGMVEEVEIFTSLLEKHARSGDTFHLEEGSLNLTIHLIGRVVMVVVLKDICAEQPCQC